MSRGRRILVLGGGDGWHADQLRTAAQKIDSQIAFTDYESLTASVASVAEIQCGAGRLHDFDSVLTRTMPAGSLEKITFRLACMHSLVDQGQHLVNHPRSLEIAIDKFATLAKVSQSGYPVPRTRVAQDRHSAMRAFHEFDGDCVVKPVFGGEGRGVMRIRDPQLAVYTFATLDQLDSVFYVQEFVSPGGADTRMLVVGDHVFGLRRQNETDFRTNVSHGSCVQPVSLRQEQVDMAMDICRAIGLQFASVDVLDSDDGVPKVVEVNGIPGWRGAQSVMTQSIANAVVRLLVQNTDCVSETA